MPDQDDAPNSDEGDKYIGMEVLLPRGDGYHNTKVAHMNQNVDGDLIDLRNANLILDTTVYDAVFPGGEGLEESTNQVSETIIISFGAEVNEFMMFREILDHRSDDKAIIKEYGFIH